MESSPMALPVETDNIISRLQRVREEELDNLSKQLHNVVGQDLTCLKISAYRLSKHTDVVETPELREEIGKMITLIDTIMGSVREIAKDVRPRVLEAFGLVPAIESLLHDLRSVSSLEYKLINKAKTIKVQPVFTNDILKICKALLSVTTGATVKITGDEQMTSILVQSHGDELRNIDWIEEHLLFLRNLQERAVVFGGQISITFDGGKGFRALIRIPIQSQTLSLNI